MYSLALALASAKSVLPIAMKCFFMPLILFAGAFALTSRTQWMTAWYLFSLLERGWW
jgi:hypothetical protein